jgi:hypothetical protein
LQLKIKDIALHEKNGGRWAALPAKPILKDGVQVKDDAGKPQYVNIIEFTSRAVKEAFAAAVIAAVLEHTPGAFDVADQPQQASGGGGFHDDAIPFMPEWR